MLSIIRVCSFYHSVQRTHMKSSPLDGTLCWNHALEYLFRFLWRCKMTSVTVWRPTESLPGEKPISLHGRPSRGQWGPLPHTSLCRLPEGRQLYWLPTTGHERWTSHRFPVRTGNLQYKQLSLMHEYFFNNYRFTMGWARLCLITFLSSFWLEQIL